jgi:hypothetical protein
MPDNRIILANDGTTLDILKNIEKVINNPVDIEEEISRFKKFYEKTGIQHKDLIFSWVLISPFLHVILKILNFAPPLALHGIGDVGKSTLLVSLILKGFGATNEPLNTTNINSNSRFESYLSGSTFPILIDDISEANKKQIDFLKSSLTVGGRNQKKGSGTGMQFYSIDKPYITSWATTFNIPPIWLSDDLFLQRIFMLYISEMKQIEGWSEAEESLERGYLTRILYNYTKNFTRKDLRKMLKSYKIPVTIKYEKERLKSFWQIFSLGKFLMKDIFDIDVDIEKILDLICDTRSMNFEDLKSLMIYQIIHGQIQERKFFNNSEEGSIDSFLQDNNKKNYQTEDDTKYYLPNDPWVKTPLYSTKNDYLFDTNNIRELQTRYEGRVDKYWNTKTFLQIIQNHIPAAQIKVTRVSILINGKLESKGIYAVTIPKEELEIKVTDNLDNINKIENIYNEKLSNAKLSQKKIIYKIYDCLKSESYNRNTKLIPKFEFIDSLLLDLNELYSEITRTEIESILMKLQDSKIISIDSEFIKLN